MDDHYIAGFVDGEGSFHIAFQRSQDVRLGWQAVPEFHLSQNVESKAVLERIRDRLGCGYLKVNHRFSQSDKTYVLVVRNRDDLCNKVVPFFRKFPLHTQKAKDFEIFVQVLEMMKQKNHLDVQGFVEIVNLAYLMNAAGARRRVPKETILKSLKSSETTCQRPPLSGQDIVRTPRRRGDLTSL